MLVLSCLVLIVFQGFLVQSKSILPETINYAVANSFNKTANILHVVIETDFDENKETFIDVIDTILEEKWNFRLQIDVNNKDGQAVSDYNLWFIDSYEAFRRLLPWIRGYLKDSQLFYFIVLGNRLEVDEHLNVTQKIFSDFLMLMIANVNVITETASGEVLIYTFYPYQELACRSTKPLLTHHRRWFNNNSMISSRNFFPPKADNFHKCPLRITTKNQLILTSAGYKFSNKLINYEMSILELIMANEFAYRMNFTFEIQDIHFSDTDLLNETSVIPTENIKMMENGKTDLVLSFVRYDHLENKFLSKSVPYYLTWLVICLRRPRPNTFHMNGWLFIPFNVTTWIYTVVSFTLVTGFIILAKKNKRFSRVFHLHNNQPGGLEILSVTIGAPVGHLPSKNSLRFCVIVLSLGALILRSAYQGKLYDAYLGRKIFNSPHSIRELSAENYTVYAQMYYLSLINDLNKVEYLNFRKLESGLRGVDIFESGKKIALVTSYVAIYTFYTADERKNLILEPILREQICIFFQQHSVIQPRINEIVMRMEEAGILHHFRRNFENINGARFSSNKTEHEPRALVLQQFAITFYLWGMLCVISCIVFVAELVWHKVK